MTAKTTAKRVEIEGTTSRVLDVTKSARTSLNTTFARTRERMRAVDVVVRVASAVRSAFASPSRTLDSYDYYARRHARLATTSTRDCDSTVLIILLFETTSSRRPFPTVPPVKHVHARLLDESQRQEYPRSRS